MNVTQEQLLRNYLADHLGSYPLEWWMYALMWIGAVALLFLFAAGFWHLVKAKKKADLLCDPDVHPSIACTCPYYGHPSAGLSPKCSIHGAEFFRRNRTNTLSIVEMHRKDGA